MSEITTSKVEARVEVNEDGQIVWKTGVIRSDTCSHMFDPVVLPRKMSLDIARAVLDAQGEKHR